MRKHKGATTTLADSAPLSPSSLCDYLVSLIHQSFSAELYNTALFLSERLCCLLPNDETAVFLLAYALFRTSNPHGAISALQVNVQPPNKSLDEATANNRPNTRQISTWRQQQSVMKPAKLSSMRCAWLYAKACSEVGRAREGQDVLSQALATFTPLHEQDLQLPTANGPNSAALFVQLAHSCLKSQNQESAAVFFLEALRQSWWCWEAFEGLCFLGQAPDNIEEHFGWSANDSHGANGNSNSNSNSNGNGVLGNSPNAGNRQFVFSTAPVAFPSTTVVPPAPNQSFDSTESSSFDASFLHAPAPTSTRAATAATSSSALFTPPSSSMPLPKNAPPPNRRGKETIRRTTRVTTAKVPSTSANNVFGSAAYTYTANLFGEKPKGKEPRSRVTSNPREKKRVKPSMSPPPVQSPLQNVPNSVFSSSASTNNTSLGNSNGNVSETPEMWLRAVMSKFAVAEACLSRFEAQPAIDSILTLEIEQRRSWRASAIIGRARMEALDYAGADKAFAAAREAAPYMITYSDLHSTLLWHLSRSTDLSYLAQQIMTLQPLSPEAWICSGNVFSLLDDHTNALKCFKRAIQLVESDFGSGQNGNCGSNRASVILQGNSAGEYPFVMAGHECVALEEWENAQEFFREAIQRRKRCYTAWFGLGNVYMRTQKLKLAEYHFRKAVEINPNNAMLISCVGTVLEKSSRKSEALHQYERACHLAPQSAAVHFKKVKLLVHLKQYDRALKDLLSLAALAPDEFIVQFLLGKVYGHLGKRALMTKHFTFAQDLDPRSAQRIRDTIENLAFKEDDAKEDANMTDG